MSMENQLHALYDNSLVVGVPGHNSRFGIVYVYEKDVTNEWNEVR